MNVILVIGLDNLYKIRLMLPLEPYSIIHVPPRAPKSLMGAKWSCLNFH